MNLSPDMSIAGVLVPLFALRTEDDLGIGDLNALRQFIDWAAGVGFHLVQLLPINETGRDNSPYNAISAVALDPLTLHLAPGSPDDLVDEDFNEVMVEFDLGKLRKGAVKYPRVRALKMRLLHRAFTRFTQRSSAQPVQAREFEQFCERERAWLDDYVFFRALMRINGEAETWDQWQPPHRAIESARHWLQEQPREVRDGFANQERFFRYVQWIAEAQWRAAKSYGESRGVALMGDIPFGVSYYSADVFARPNEFKLEWSGGAPPERYFKDDEFTQKWGQNWGIPLYRWEVMRKRNFDWWRLRVRGVRRIFHVFRIDHVLGFYRIYAFPWRPWRNTEFLPLDWEQMREKTNNAVPHFDPRDDSTQEHRQANQREGEEYLRAVLAESGETRVVGEDLGTVPEYVRPSLHSLGIAGFKIPQWETRPDGSVIHGSEYQRLSVATYATHDHKPLRAMWEEALEKPSSTREQALQDLAKIARFAGLAVPNEQNDYTRDFYSPIMRALFACESWIAIVMITDLLARKDRFNVPGTAENSNWSRRMHLTVGRLSASRVVQGRMRLLLGLLAETGRAAPMSS